MAELITAYGRYTISKMKDIAVAKLIPSENITAAILQ
jgi:hypothetical protein